MAFGNINNIIKISKDKAEENNYKLDTFEKLQNDEQNLEELSVIQKYFDELNTKQSFGTGMGVVESSMNNLYGAVPTNKVQRLASYRKMASFPELNDAIEEICDDSINKNQDQNVVDLEILNTNKIQGIAENQIKNSFNEYINLFNFENNMFDYMKQLIVDGELAWENIISKDHKDYGIIGINFIQPESYEFAFTVDGLKVQGLAILTDKKDIELNDPIKGEEKSKTVTGGLTIKNLSCYDLMKDGQAVFLPWEQLTYINTGHYNSTKLIVYPIIERCRKAYNQLSLIEDSIIIYRLVRAPERYVFNVDVGNLSPRKAEQEVYKMMRKHQTKQIYNSDEGTIDNAYNPMSMLESYWFVKSANGNGTEVDTLGGAQNLGELDDLIYFLKKLYRTLKIPFTRYEDPTVNIERIESITREEYKFAKFVMRLQCRFSKGLMDGFKTHLKLKGLWDQYKLKYRDLFIKFTPPMVYEIYENQRLLQIKTENYETISRALETMNSWALKRYLNLSNDEIEEIWKSKEEDQVKAGRIEWKFDNARQTGKPEGVQNQDEGDFGSSRW